MPKNTRNVTFPVEQEMYDRLQAFKKAPGLGEAGRRALRYLIDHPNEVLNPGPKGLPTPQQKPEPKDEPGKSEFKRRILESRSSVLRNSRFKRSSTSGETGFGRYRS